MLREAFQQLNITGLGRNDSEDGASMSACIVTDDATTTARLGVWGSSLDDVAEDIDAGKDCTLLSMSDYAVWDIVHMLLDRTGPADLYFGVYNLQLSDTATRQLRARIDAGDIKRVVSLNDVRNVSKSFQTVEILDEHADHKNNVLGCHAKVTVITGERDSFAIESSSNLFGKKRIELYHITRSAETCRFHRQWIDSVSTRERKTKGGKKR